MDRKVASDRPVERPIAGFVLSLVGGLFIVAGAIWGLLTVASYYGTYLLSVSGVIPRLRRPRPRVRHRGPRRVRARLPRPAAQGGVGRRDSRARRSRLLRHRERILWRLLRHRNGAFPRGRVPRDRVEAPGGPRVRRLPHVPVLRPSRLGRIPRMPILRGASTDAPGQSAAAADSVTRLPSWTQLAAQPSPVQRMSGACMSPADSWSVHGSCLRGLRIRSCVRCNASCH